MDTIFDDYSIDKMYYVNSYSQTNGFTKLMVLVLNTSKYPELNEQIPLYIDDINKQNCRSQTALILACRNCMTDSTVDTVKILIECGANLNVQDDEGWTALMHVVRMVGSIEVVKLLLDCGADPHLKDDDDGNSIYIIQ